MVGAVALLFEQPEIAFDAPGREANAVPFIRNSSTSAASNPPRTRFSSERLILEPFAV